MKKNLKIIERDNPIFLIEDDGSLAMNFYWHRLDDGSIDYYVPYSIKQQDLTMRNLNSLRCILESYSYRGGCNIKEDLHAQCINEMCFRNPVEDYVYI